MHFKANKEVHSFGTHWKSPSMQEFGETKLQGLIFELATGAVCSQLEPSLYYSLYSHCQQMSVYVEEERKVPV